MICNASEERAQLRQVKFRTGAEGDVTQSKLGDKCEGGNVRRLNHAESKGTRECTDEKVPRDQWKADQGEKYGDAR